MFCREPKFRLITVFVSALFCFQLIFTNLFVSSGYAQEDQRLQEAKELYDNTQYEEAITILKKLVSDAGVLPDRQKIQAFELLALAHHRLEQFNEAKQAYLWLLRTSLEHSFDTAKVPPKRADFFEQLKGKLSFLVIHARPAELNVYLDGELQTSKTPNQYVLFEGQHHILVETPDSTTFDSWEGDEYFGPGERKELTAELQPRAVSPAQPISPGALSPPPAKPIYKKWWFWAAAGVVGSGVYMLTSKGPDETGTLPNPPDRPSN